MYYSQIEAITTLAIERVDFTGNRKDTYIPLEQKHISNLQIIPVY